MTCLLLGRNGCIKAFYVIDRYITLRASTKRQNGETRRYLKVIVEGCVIALLQAIILVVDRTRLEGVFRRIYRLAVRRLVAALAKHPAVVCILGGDSFFEERASRWVTGVDLIILLNEQVTRNEAAHGEIAHIYERVRRIFPILGPWHEEGANLVFLSDIAAGFPAPEPFRSLHKLGCLTLLYGEVPENIVIGSLTASELLEQINALLRRSLMSAGWRVRQPMFWKHVFSRLSELAERLGLADCAEEIRICSEMNLPRGSSTLRLRKAGRNHLFSLQLSLSRRLFDALAAREVSVRIRPVPLKEHPIPVPLPTPFSSVLDLSDAGQFTIRDIPSVPIGCTPRHLCFPIDCRVPVLEITKPSYDGLQRLRRSGERESDVPENVLVSVEGFLFIAARQSGLVDLIPLDPLQYANVYAPVFQDSLEFEMPASILAEQRAEAAAMFRGHAHLSRVNEGLVTKLSYPCIYREHDAELIDSALRMLRVQIAWDSGAILIQSSSDLYEYLRQRHQECASFLSKLEAYQRSFAGGSILGYVDANNTYRCLHQFMSQALLGAAAITVDAPQKHLGITVGVITRNRAADLAEMFDSLAGQLRAPDEVLVVDNGSTDDTEAVIENFRDRLPIRREFLQNADIPGARNLVLERAAHDIVAFIDDDCVCECDWLAGVEVGFLRADNIGIVGGWVTHQPAIHHSTVENYYRVFHNIKS